MVFNLQEYQSESEAQYMRKTFEDFIEKMKKAFPDPLVSKHLFHSSLSELKLLLKVLHQSGGHTWIQLFVIFKHLAYF